MASNIEIKARARDWDELHRRAAALSAAPAELLEQDDTFYRSPRGRLKLRVLGPSRAELIYYERADEACARPSFYTVAPVADAAALDQALSAALGALGRVEKRRWLYRVGQTRIHLDEVSGLGRFIEIEYVLQPGEEHENGLRVVAELLARLGVLNEDLLSKPYLELFPRG